MKLRGLLTAATLLAALSGALWWSNRREARAGKESEVSRSIRPLSVPEDQVQEITLQKQNGESIHLKKTDGKWQITEPVQYPADPEIVSGMISTLALVNEDHVIEDKATDVAAYGLNKPAIKVGIVDSNHKTKELLIGDETPAGSANYVEMAGDQRVFTMANYMKNSLDKTPIDLRDKRLLKFESDKVTKVELSAKKQTIEFGRNKEQWEIVKPSPLRADQFPVEELLRSLRDAKMDLKDSQDQKRCRPQELPMLRERRNCKCGRTKTTTTRSPAGSRACTRSRQASAPGSTKASTISATRNCSTSAIRSRKKWKFTMARNPTRSPRARTIGYRTARRWTRPASAQ